MLLAFQSGSHFFQALMESVLLHYLVLRPRLGGAILFNTQKEVGFFNPRGEVCLGVRPGLISNKPKAELLFCSTYFLHFTISARFSSDWPMSLRRSVRAGYRLAMGKALELGPFS
jgi:hypothetical protein